MGALEIILAIIGTNAATALLSSLLFRKQFEAEVEKTRAETAKLEGEEKRSETTYYQRQVESMVQRMSALDDEVKRLRSEITLARETYEQQASGLLIKMDSLTKELERANLALDKANLALDEANETIKNLRQEIKEGNESIIELREKISQLLIDRAEKNEENKN